MGIYPQSHRSSEGYGAELEWGETRRLEAREKKTESEISADDEG